MGSPQARWGLPGGSPQSAVQRRCPLHRHQGGEGSAFRLSRLVQVLVPSFLSCLSPGVIARRKRRHGCLLSPRLSNLVPVSAIGKARK